MERSPDQSEGVSKTRKDRRKAPSDAPPDVGIEIGRHKFKVESRETRLEIVARLNADKAKLDNDLRKEFEVFRGVMAIVAVATAACLYLVLSNRYPPAIQNAAMALLAAVVSGGVGYVTGRSSR